MAGTLAKDAAPLGRMAPPPGAIDCDLHIEMPGMATLMPHLDRHWAGQMVLRGIDGLDPVSYPPGVPANARPDWRPAQGRAGASLAGLQAQALDAFGTRLAVAHCLYAVQAVMDHDMAAGLARGINDWVAREWLDREPRLRASIVVTQQDPALAVAEIERLAGDRRFVGVLLLCMGEVPLGKRQFWPIYAAAERHGLAICVHAGSNYRHATANTGWPSYYVEEYVNHAEAFQTQILSLVLEGVFLKFPRLSVVMMESGFAWLGPFMWRATKTWRGTRMEYPWIDEAPTDIIRRHFRFTLQPDDTPPTRGQLERVLTQLGDDRMLLFSSDYPHWHYEGLGALPDGLAPDLVRRICVDNPLAAFPRLTEA